MFPIDDRPDADSVKFMQQPLVKHFRPDVAALFEGLQPYHGGDIPDALAKLNAYNRFDKHRVTHVAASAVDFSSASYRPAMHLDLGVEYFNNFLSAGFDITTFTAAIDRPEDNAKIAEIRFNAALPADPNLVQVQVARQPTMHVFFRAGGEVKDLGVLGNLCAQVTNVVRFFSVFDPARS